MYVNAGELNKRIEIIEKGGMGERGFRNNCQVIRKCYAKYTRKTGKERNAAGSDTSESYIRFLIRYTKTIIDTNMQVRYKGEVYEIEDVNDINDEHRYIELYCKRGEL